MRIIAGRFRGRKLVSFDASHIRPTTDRVKESIFNKLQGDFSGARVLDLFSGTGNLSIESVSRGAIDVEAVEVNSKSVRIIRQNLKSLDIENEVKVVQQDVFQYLRNFNGTKFDIILADPPFTEKFGDRLLRSIADSRVLAEAGVCVVETHSKDLIEVKYGALELFDDRDYGDKRVTFWQWTSEGEAK